MPNILVVEDDISLNNGIVLSLRQDDFMFLQAFSLKEAKEKLNMNNIDLIILDVNLPDGSGYDFCREIRQTLSVPIIFLTANDMELDIVTGLELGGDDYITKPFSLMVLRARVASILRRTKQLKSDGRIVIDNFIFDFDKMEFYKNGQELSLSKTEQKLLKILIKNQGQTISRATLIDKIWTDGAEYVDENALSVTISRLRNKIEDDPAKPEYIHTVYGIGYQWRREMETNAMKTNNSSFLPTFSLYIVSIIVISILFGLSTYFKWFTLSQTLTAYILLIFIFTIVFLFLIKYKVKTTMQRLDSILENALNNNMSNLSYDETMISALESKLYRLFTISSSSAKAVAEEKDRIKTLVADISHQTKTPISNILLYTQLLQEQEDISEEARKYASEIRSQSEKLSFLIQSLVKVSRLETGIITLNPQLSSVGKLIESSINNVRKEAEEKNISLEYTCEDNLKSYFDPKWTEEVINIILDNAIKYTPEGGIVSILATKYELFTRIDITDKGIGIKEQEINHIFKRFYRSPSVSQYEGVGIGLYLAREIISGEGGYIKVKSQPLKGSTFSVFLPNNKG